MIKLKLRGYSTVVAKSFVDNILFFFKLGPFYFNWLSYHPYLHILYLHVNFSISFNLQNTSCLERQQFMEKFISEVQQIHGDVRGGILNQLVDCCASGNFIM